MKGVFSGERMKRTPNNNATQLLRGIDKSLVIEALCAALEDGAAVMLAQTRDAGALCITVLHGNERSKAYASDAEELLTLISDLSESFGVSIITTRGGARRAVKETQALNGSDPSKD